MGGFYKSDKITEEHDRTFNLFYLSMYRTKSKGIISTKGNEDFNYSKITNIAVFDIAKNTTAYLFSKVGKEEIITHLLFESYYHEDNRCIIFNRHSSKILNNEAIEKRALLNKLIVCQKNETTGSQKLWSFDKHGNDKTLIADLVSGTEWRLDVYNQTIITFKRYSDKVDFNSYRY